MTVLGDRGDSRLCVDDRSLRTLLPRLGPQQSQPLSPPHAVASPMQRSASARGQDRQIRAKHRRVRGGDCIVLHCAPAHLLSLAEGLALGRRLVRLYRGLCEPPLRRDPAPHGAECTQRRSAQKTRGGKLIKQARRHEETSTRREGMDVKRRGASAPPLNGLLEGSLGGSERRRGGRRLAARELPFFSPEPAASPLRGWGAESRTGRAGISCNAKKRGQRRVSNA